MGSFNTTCFASQQTIAPGDACVVIPLVQKSTYQAAEGSFRGQAHALHGITSSTCYPTAFWRPVGGFFDAEYDDYGRVTLADNAHNRKRLLDFLHYVLPSTATVALGENQYHDLAFDFPAFLAEKTPELGAWLTRKNTDPEVPFDAGLFFKQGVACWDYIWEVASEHRLFGLDYQQQLQPIEFAVMHRATHDLLVAETERGTDWDGHTLEQRAYFDKALAKGAERLAEFIKDEDPHGMRAFHFMSEVRQTLQAVGGFEGSRYPGETDVLNTYGVRYAQDKLSADELFRLLQPYMNARYVMASLERLNIKVTPMVYAGQDYSNEIGKAYARFIRGASAAVNKDRRTRGY